MIKKPAFFFTLALIATTSFGQAIQKWKIEDVVRSFSANNDTVYVVSFWATFCKPCNEEIPDFIKIVDRYKTQKVKLLLVSLDLPSYFPKKIESFIKKNGYTTNHAWLSETNADHFCPMIDEKWSGAIPATIIVNNSKGYRKFVEDQMGPEEFENAIREAIGAQAAGKYISPMIGARVMGTEARGPHAGSGEYISFRSANSAVFAINEGMVTTIAKIDGMKIIIVEDKGLYYTYSNLGSTLIKTGDRVGGGQLLGYAALELYGDTPLLDLYVSDNEKNIKLSERDFSDRKYRRESDHSFDPLRLPQ